MIKLSDEFREDVPLKCWKFPAGEVGVKLEGFVGSDILIDLHWEGNDDIMMLLQLVDILHHMGRKKITLRCLYFPYARQDRRCFTGESHSLKVVAQLINSCNFDKVIVADAHSSVLDAVVNNLDNIPQESCAVDLPTFDYIIAPDAGAAKKIYNLDMVKNGVPVITASKQRDSNGKIIKTVVDNCPILDAKSVCVVDDVADGGATFIELGKVLKAQYPCAKLSLYVTHGLFTKGVTELLTIYHDIYTYNLMNKDVKQFVKEV